MKVNLTLDEIKTLITENPSNTMAVISLLLDALDDAAKQIIKLQEEVAVLENRLKYTRLGPRP